MHAFSQRLAKCADCFVFCYPNAGLPNAMGGYDDTPAAMGRALHEFAADGYINLAGGCCGSTPPHIKAIADAVAPVKPRTWAPAPAQLNLSGLEPLAVNKSLQVGCRQAAALGRWCQLSSCPLCRWCQLSSCPLLLLQAFVNVGERCNISGSIQFKKLILAVKFQDAMAVARKQVGSSSAALWQDLERLRSCCTFLCPLHPTLSRLRREAWSSTSTWMKVCSTARRPW
jgi:5-methyltetrahydrofolate--homocysteine methyltransferase